MNCYIPSTCLLNPSVLLTTQPLLDEDLESTPWGDLDFSDDTVADLDNTTSTAHVDQDTNVRSGTFLCRK